MKTIKFRYIFKHISSGNIEVKYYYLNQLEDRPTKELSPCFVADYELLSRGQYTGQNDDTNKEIYEDDITISALKSADGEKFRDVVKFENGCFVLADKYQHLHNLCIGDKDIIGIEVIGNIYENPDLIESKEEC